MAEPKLSKLEFQIMEALWTQGDLSIREIQEAFPAKRRPAYTTIQTTDLPTGSERCCSPGEEGRELPHLRRRGFPRVLPNGDLSTTCWRFSGDAHNQ